MFFDSHAHYDDRRFDVDREILLESMKQKGVSYILNAASNIATSLECINLAENYDFIYASVGVHPHDVGDISENAMGLLADLAKNPRVVAVGEIGLDYYYDHSPREVQRYWFRRQIQLAKELDLPVIIHNRDAHADSMEIVTSEDISSIGGVFHCFSGSWEMAKKLLEMGIYISIAGPITFNNAVKSIEVVKNLPIDKLLIETDCPYLTPIPHRGKRNDSTYIRYTAEKIAEIKGITVEEVAERTMENTKRLFRILD
ncbi:MAG: TatD DNase family protein [Petroclostridium sp.]|jgi:TatD DNase family protein|uniref:TatD family hydrolase n=1 Tax=Petroclostridium xylanilyticum TaxID=1792311 RepID=UPI000B99287C|nr:TatD family hydrolase [Petroclostridium xylanilyticum]MBZ4646114.1 ycfH [Clostridia bacterium]MDK2810934.1 TatD DNase family protein [Petroclostridium sp.]